jgi:regulator of replication initiation timing
MAFNHLLGKDGADRLARLESRIESLEEESKKIRTCDVHVRRFLTIEKELGSLVALKKKFTARTLAADTRQSPGPALEDKHVEKMIDKALGRYLQQIENLEQRLQHTENALFRLDKENSELRREISAFHADTKENPHMDTPSSHTDPMCSPPVIFQEFHIDRFIVDKYELTNNINQLGVKELSGQMNIGATYGGGITPQDFPGSEGESDDSPDEKEGGEEQPPE